MSVTRLHQHIHAPRAEVYRTLLDPGDIPKWKVPDGMTCHVHEFEAREGGTLRVSLTYDAPNRGGKTTAQTDTYHGRFMKLVRDEQIIEVDEFETSDPSLQGEMTTTITLVDADDGTTLMATHEGLPSGLSSEDNETGWRMALEKLAGLVEARVAGKKQPRQ